MEIHCILLDKYLRQKNILQGNFQDIPCHLYNDMGLLLLGILSCIYFYKKNHSHVPCNLLHIY